jgi:hypothetical protein
MTTRTRLSVPIAIFGPLLYVGGLVMFLVIGVHWHDFQLPSFITGIGAAMFMSDLCRFIRGRVAARAKKQLRREDVASADTPAQPASPTVLPMVIYGPALKMRAEAKRLGVSIGTVAQQRFRDGLGFNEVMVIYIAACRLQWNAEHHGR